MLDFFRDIVSALRTHTVERVKNPALGAFAFSWVVFNWDKILILLFSKADIEHKISAIKASSNLLTAMGYPALAAAFICLVMPYLMAIVVSLQNGPTLAVMSRYAERNSEILRQKIITEELRAKADIAYKRTLTNEESEIQEMKDTIATSQGMLRELTKERDEALANCNEMRIRSEQLERILFLNNDELNNAKKKIKSIEDEFNKYKAKHPEGKSIFGGEGPIFATLDSGLKSFDNPVTLGSALAEAAKNPSSSLNDDQDKT